MSKWIDRMVGAVLGIALFAAGAASAGLIVRPNTYSSGQVISASAINDDFDTLYTLVNGNIGDANVSGLSASEVTGTAATLTGGSEQTVTRDTLMTGQFTLGGATACDSTVFSDLDATPAVNTGATCYETGNTGATTITDFDSAVEGQVIIVQINDVNTVIQHGANIIGRQAEDMVNTTAGAGEYRSRYNGYIYLSNKWYQIFAGGTT